MHFNKREDIISESPPASQETVSTPNGKDVGSVVDSQLYVQLRKLINVVDELRDIGLQQFIQLPRICVVGTQSAGKSSVLEAIVGLDFLPRGDGVVTRRPLELRLVHLPESEHHINEAYAIFENQKEKKYRDFQEVREEIDRLTDQVAGKNKGIIDHPIVLSIYATQCPDLSLIDLPGITRVPLKGSDQSDDIEVLTRQMALRYASDPRTIVLAVIPANVDMSTSDALQLARRVDPRGVRTIGVITKIDLMDRGTDAAKMLLGEEIPLRLGYTGVRNRSQADIREGKTVKRCLEEERHFFATHPTYRLLPPQLLGVNALIEKLTRVLFRHIKHFLPEIKKEISGKTRCIVERLHELGEGVPSEAAERSQLLWTAIADYVEIFKNTIRGKYDKRLQMYFDHQKEITSGSQIRSIFNELLEEFHEKQVTEDMNDYEIDVAIRLHEGDSLPGFPSPDTFEYLILPYLKRIQAPVMDCLERVSQTLEVLSQKISSRVLGRFPLLSGRVLELSQELLQREKEHTRMILQHIVDAETGYLFTNDSTYLAEHGSMINSSNQEQQQQGGGGGGAAGVPAAAAGGFLVGGPAAAGGNAATTTAGTYYTYVGPDGKPVQQQQIPNTTHAERAQQMLSSMQQSVASIWSSTTSSQKKTVYSEQFIREIRRRLDSYFALVLRNVRDAVPKAIGYFLVRQLQEKLQFELYNQLNDESQFGELLGEPPHIMEERRALVTQLQTLKRATAVLQRDPSIAALNIEGVDDSLDRDIRELQREAAAAARFPAAPVAANAMMLPPYNIPSHVLLQQQRQQQQPPVARTCSPPPPPPSSSSGAAATAAAVVTPHAAAARGGALIDQTLPAVPSSNAALSNSSKSNGSGASGDRAAAAGGGSLVAAEGGSTAFGAAAALSHAVSNASIAAIEKTRAAAAAAANVFGDQKLMAGAGKHSFEKTVKFQSANNPLFND